MTGITNPKYEGGKEMKGFTGKLLAVLLSLSLSLILVACQGPEPTSTPTTGGVTESATPTPEPLTPVQITALAGPGTMSGVQTDPIAKEVFEKRFGLTIDFIFAGDKFEERLATEMSSGELPDLVCFTNRKQAETAVQANLLLDLDPLLAEYGQDLSANMPAMLQFMRDNLSGGSGKLYGLTNYVGSQTMTDAIHLALYTRWDLYKQVGAPQVDTYEELLPVFRQMQDLEPENDKGQKNYTFTLWADWDANEMAMANWTIVNYRGVNNSQDNGTLAFTEYNQETKQLKSMFDPDSTYLQTIRFYFKANQMGLLDPDSVTQKFDNVLNKLNDGRLLTAYWGWMAATFNGSPLVEANPLAGMIPVFPKKEARLFLSPNSPVGREFVWSVGAKTQYADRIVSLLNFAATARGAAELMNGVEGTDWSIVDGKAQFLGDNLEKFVTNDPTVKYIGMYEPMCLMSPWNVDPRTGEPINRTCWSQVIRRNLRESEKQWAEANGVLNAFDFASKNLVTVQHDAVSNMTSAPPDNIKIIQQKLAELAKAQSWKMIYAKSEAEFESLLQELLEKAQGLGSETNFEWAQNELAAAKEKAGKYVEFNVN